jgi:phospholipid transport system transporter-binding protein
MASAEARAERAGPSLRLHGHLDRAAASRLWPQLRGQLDGVTTLDLEQVRALDSAGLALLAELSACITASSGQRPALLGTPPGLEELRAAYRLDRALDPAGVSP